MQRHATARWEGDLKEGRGTLTTDSEVLASTPYSFSSRFEHGSGSNPEELIGAAHAGCLSMALSMILGEAGLNPESIETRASVSLEQSDSGFDITAVHLDVQARVPSATEEQFAECADQAKDGCPVSKVLNARITVDAKLLT